MSRHVRPLPDGLFEDRRTARARSRTASVALPEAPPEPDAESALPEELVIPDDLSSLEGDEISELLDQAVEAFNEVYGDGTNDLTDEEYDTLAAITEQVERLRAETESRDAAAAERRDGMRDLATRVNPDLAEGGPGDEEDPEGAEDGDPENPEGGEPEGEPAEGDQPAGQELAARRIPLSALRTRTARAQRPARRDGQPSMRELVSAAADLPGYSNGQGMDWADMGRAVDRRLAGFNAAQYQAARRSGRAMRQQFGVAVIRKPIPEDLMISSNDPAHVDDVIRRAADQSRLPGGSLTAAGGWCAPSTILYDLLELESSDGLVSVPEIGIARGGIQWTTGPDFSDIYNSTGWSYSEAQDIAGSYGGGTDTRQTVTVTGSPTGGTFTLTVEGVTTDPIAYNASAATVASAVTDAADAVAPGAVVTSVSGSLSSGLVLDFGGTLTGTSVPAMTASGTGLTGGTSPSVTVTSVTAGAAGTDGKPCYAVTCPEFEEARLDLMGLCVSSGLLQQRGYPEMLARTIRGALIAHEHRMAAEVIRRIAAGSTQVAVGAADGTQTGGTGQTEPILSAIELQSQHYRYIHRMPQSTTLEAIFPLWVHALIRRDLTHRIYGDSAFMSVTDAQINSWFSARGIAPQFVYNYQDLTGAASAAAYPATLQFLMYAAGTWVKGTSDILTIDTLYDSVNLAQNDFTALFTEEGFLVAKRGFDSRAVTVTLPTTLGI